MEDGCFLGCVGVLFFTFLGLNPPKMPCTHSVVGVFSTFKVFLVLRKETLLNDCFIICVFVQDAVVLRNKLLYAIESGAGFELS